MKICTKCEKEKPLEAFSKRTTGKPVSHCKECVNEKFRQNYASNRDKFAEKNRRDLPALSKRNRDYMNDYLRRNPCVDCGEADIEVLEFDHIVPVMGKKNRANVYTMSLVRLQEEIDKCEVRCCNCHRRRTRQQFNRFRD